MTSQIVPLSFVLLNLESVKTKGIIEYLESGKSFLDEIKSIFHSFWRIIIRWKNKKLADTSFNIRCEIRWLSAYSKKLIGDLIRLPLKRYKRLMQTQILSVLSIAYTNQVWVSLKVSSKSERIN